MLNKNEFLGEMIRAGFTQTTLALRIGMSKNTLSSRINGRTYFDTDEVDRVCEALKINDVNKKCKIFLWKPSQNRDEKAG